MSRIYQYRLVYVEAVQLATFESDDTISIKPWMLTAIVDGTAAYRAPTDWMVKRPDGSIKFYTNDEFHKEFESTPSCAEG